MLAFDDQSLSIDFLCHAFSMAKKRTKEDKLKRNIERLEKEAEQALALDQRRPSPEELNAIAAGAASDST
jgi:hypothetical protein